MLRALPFLCLALAACQPVDPEPRVDVERGAALFEQNCAACHGADAKGRIGPDLTTLAARNGGTFPQTRVMAQIDGLARHGKDGAVMPEFGAGDLGPTVVVEHEGLGTPVPADLLALSEYLASIQG
ncbi:c-type cytochrome [Jannaschia pohangensis]|uniref:Cytochrome C oxidase, cbb3-type, subunit III n=1 Tax=Jannaschia pohangensis TaxID=390807 RepID=A0A1I3N1Y6_9RHOB|nr:cytochrome c [Jannaschia pohangensis]SFJ03015.1 Cytochrome C oxidase, cbb3-type, subunit III [Jannaschia pohangensis]